MNNEDEMKNSLAGNWAAVVKISRERLNEVADIVTKGITEGLVNDWQSISSDEGFVIGLNGPGVQTVSLQITQQPKL